MKRVLSQTKRLLLAMLDAYGDLLISARHAHNFDRVLHPEYYKAKERDRQERAARRALWELQKTKMVEVRRKSNQILFTLTEKGRRWMLREGVKRASKCSDGECVVVIFDIPETQRKLRLYFRRFLAENNFRQLQRSVWVSRYDILENFQALIRESEAAPWIHVFRVRDFSF